MLIFAEAKLVAIAFHVAEHVGVLWSLEPSLFPLVDHGGLVGVRGGGAALRQ